MSPLYEMQNTPTVAEYVRVLTKLGDRVSDEHRRIFRAHFYAPDRSATAKQLASLADVTVVRVNSHYGKLGHILCDELGIKPELRPDESYRWWSIWSRGWQTPGGFVWQMLPKVAEALEQLGWVNSMEFVSPDEITLTQPLVEGAVCQITVNAYERNPKARRQCIEEHGRACCICSFSFGEAYGPVAEKVIHVHHLRALSEIGEEYDVDPLKDLRPLCPNCHAVLHLRKPTPFSIQEVRELLGGKIIRAVTPNEGAATVRHEA